jgi:hypothetical protein
VVFAAAVTVEHQVARLGREFERLLDASLVMQDLEAAVLRVSRTGAVSGLAGLLSDAL